MIFFGNDMSGILDLGNVDKDLLVSNSSVLSFSAIVLITIFLNQILFNIYKSHPITNYDKSFNFKLLLLEILTQSLPVLFLHHPQLSHDQ